MFVLSYIHTLHRLSKFVQPGLSVIPTRTSQAGILRHSGRFQVSREGHTAVASSPVPRPATDLLRLVCLATLRSTRNGTLGRAHCILADGRTWSGKQHERGLWSRPCHVVRHSDDSRQPIVPIQYPGGPTLQIVMVGTLSCLHPGFLTIARQTCCSAVTRRPVRIECAGAFEGQCIEG